MRMKGISRQSEERDVFDTETSSHIHPVATAVRKDELMKGRILHITFSIDRGGLETFALHLCRGIKGKFEPIICTLSSRGDLEEDFARLGVPTYHVIKSEGIDPLLPIKLALLMRRLRIGLVHTHNVAPLIYGGLAAFITGVPLVHTEHSRLPKGRNRLRLAERVMSFKASKIVAVSGCVADQLREEQGLPGHKLTVIPNGIDTEPFRRARREREKVRAELGIEKREIAIGTVGRLVPVKDQTTLIQAFGLIKAKGGRAVKLIIVGDGPERKKLERTAEEIGVRKDVLLLGMRDDVPRLMAAMDIFVLSSLDEGLPLAILEAFAGGVPVVATDVGGVGEAVKHGVNGLLVPPLSPQAMAASCLKLIQEPEMRERFSAEARRAAFDRFSLKRMVEAYEAVYEEAMGR
jgi:sugar transferase (PEP-CTERM/EpsH1 system associated)